MGIATSVQRDDSVGQKTSAAREFRIIPRIETWPKVISFVQTPLGKAALLATFAIGLRYFIPAGELVVMGPIAVIAFLPEFRRFVLAVTPVAIVFISSLSAGNLLSMAATLAVIVAGMLLYVYAMRWPKARFARRPILFTLSGLTVLIAWASLVPPHSRFYAVAWTLVEASVSYVWFICYALTDRASNPAKDTTLELVTFRPLWGSTTTPFPKGAAYLRRIEAKTPEQLATTQLKGLKLLVWAIILAIIEHWWMWLFHGQFKIPSPVEAMTMSVHGTPPPWLIRWVSQILFFFEVTLRFAVMGHQIIAVCRMAGFNAVRNSYRPLSATTIAEFFNRFYYYFKELLVDLFFYPTFLRYFKQHRRLRVFFATFVAIAFGNSYFHLVRDWQFIQRDGLWKGLAGYQVLLFYNVIMATAIAVSQLRKRNPISAGFFRRRIVQPAGVVFFYCLLGVFGDETRSYTLGVHLKYFASLFFIRL